MDVFTINEKTYQARDIDFAFLVRMDKAGVPIENISGIAALNLYLSYCAGISEEQASNEISQHFIKGGNLDGIGQAYGEKMTESDFFRSITGATATEPETEKDDSKPTKKTTKKKESVTSD